MYIIIANDAYAYLKGGMPMTKEEAYKILCSILYNGIKREVHEDDASFNLLPYNMEVEIKDGVVSIYDGGEQTLVVEEGVTCIASQESETIIRASIALMMVTDFLACKNLRFADEEFFSADEYYEQMGKIVEILARGIMVSVKGGNNHD